MTLLVTIATGGLRSSRSSWHGSPVSAIGLKLAESESVVHSKALVDRYMRGGDAGGRHIEQDLADHARQGHGAEMVPRMMGQPNSEQWRGDVS